MKLYRREFAFDAKQYGIQRLAPTDKMADELIGVRFGQAFMRQHAGGRVGVWEDREEFEYLSVRPKDYLLSTDTFLLVRVLEALRG